MSEVKKKEGVAPGSLEGARSATGSEPGAGAGVKRWSANRKKEVVLRLLRGESVDALSRELGIEIYRLEQWHERARAALDAGLRERGDDPLSRQLDAAKQRIGELTMEIEILRRERQSRRPLALRRSSR
jgi:predicted  nucleic acid-binding Zn-ribbon protein